MNCSLSSIGQEITIIPFFGQDTLKLDHYYPFGNDSIRISKFKMYVSFNDQPLLWSADKWSETQLDYSSQNELHILAIGVDSLLCSSGEFTEDLDPIEGMYWAWQSGYVNFKLEGNSNLCDTRKNAFTFHIGGYVYPNNAFRSFEIDCSNGSLILDISNYFKEIDLSVQNHVMSPGKDAQRIADKFENLFLK
ncbi:MAG: MbnP family protein [Bacteroidota bacterium]